MELGRVLLRTKYLLILRNHQKGSPLDFGSFMEPWWCAAGLLLTAESWWRAKDSVLNLGSPITSNSYLCCCHWCSTGCCTWNASALALGHVWPIVPLCWPIAAVAGLSLHHNHAFLALACALLADEHPSHQAQAFLVALMEAHRLRCSTCQGHNLSLSLAFGDPLLVLVFALIHSIFSTRASRSSSSCCTRSTFCCNWWTVSDNTPILVSCTRSLLWYQLIGTLSFYPNHSQNKEKERVLLREPTCNDSVLGNQTPKPNVH